MPLAYTQVGFETAVFEELDEIAEERGTSRSQVIRDAVHETYEVGE